MPTENQTTPRFRVQPIVEFLARAHHIGVDPQDLDAAARRVSAGTTNPYDAVRRLAGEVGLTTAVVRRPLREVLADADRSYPWLALRPGDGDVTEAIAILGPARGGVSVVALGGPAQPTRWSRGAVLGWLGHLDPETVVDWVVAEAAAPLAPLRSLDGRPPLDPQARLKALLGAERTTLGVAVVYSVVIALLSLMVPVAVQSLVNTIAFGSVLQPLVVLTLFVFVALGFSTVMNALRAVVVELIQRSIFARVATDVTWRLLRVRAEAFDRYHGPELVNRFFDTVTVQKSAALLLIDGLSITMQASIGMLLLALYHPWLLAFDVLLVVAMLAIVFLFGRGAVATSIGESKAKYALEAWLEQLAAHLLTFKSEGGARLAIAKSQKLLEDYLAYRTKHFRILLRQVVGSFALQAVASSALLGIGGWLVIERQLTLGQLVASELVVAGMLSAFTKFGKQLEVYYDLCAAIDKLGVLVDLPLERNSGHEELPRTGPMSVSIRGLELRYADARRPALAVTAWDVAPGDRIGVTGPKGAGKSTLADVLFGLRTPVSGVLRLDGTDARAIALPELRRHAALVRDAELFPGTVLDNVGLGRQDVTHADVAGALDAVGLLEDLLAMPEGLETELHAHGRPLSRRQASRLIIARAIVARPRLIIIDGALDPVDHGTEHTLLADVLFAPDAPWTLICITERPDLLARCTKVVRLEAGDIRAIDEQREEQ